MVPGPLGIKNASYCQGPWKPFLDRTRRVGLKEEVAGLGPHWLVSLWDSSAVLPVGSRSDWNRTNQFGLARSKVRSFRLLITPGFSDRELAGYGAPVYRGPYQG